MWYFVLLPVSLFTAHQIRHGNLQEQYFHFVGWLQGVTVTITKDPNQFALYDSDHKGFMIEKHVAQQAWYPLLSMESEDGLVYQKLLVEFHTCMNKIRAKPSTHIIESKTREYCQEYCQKHSCITSTEICEIVVRVLFFLVFDHEVASSDLSLMIDAGNEWRKEIAVKGLSNRKIKTKFMTMLERLVNTTDIYKLSVIAQPFLLSPQINISDIMVEWKTNMDLSLSQVLAKNHPFPILERFDKTQVMLVMPQSTPHKVLWGHGRRRCKGIDIASPLLSTLHTSLKNHPNFQPKLNHKYSGRDNDDNVSVMETLYQVYVFIKIPLVICLNRCYSLGSG